MRDSPGHIPPPTSSSHPPTLGVIGGGGGPPPQQPPQSNLSIFSADSEYIRNFLSSVPAVFPVSPGAMLAELTGYAPLSPSHGYHMSLHSSPARRSPSPHRTSFPSPGYNSLIPRIGSGSNKHVYAPILPSRAYDCTPIPSPPPLHDSQHTSSILGLAGTFSPVRRQSQDFAKDMTVEDNLEQSGTSNVLASSSFGLNSSGGGLLEDPGSPIQTEFGDESVMQLTAIGGESQDNTENLISKTEQSATFTTGNKKQDKKNKVKIKSQENSSTICTSNPAILTVPGEIIDQKKSSSLKPKLASCEITPVEENAKQVADKLSKGCNCERNCFKDLDPVMVFSHRKSISKLSKIVPLSDVCLPNQFEAELITGRKIVNEEDALQVMQDFHAKGVKTVILSSTELGDTKHLVGLASCKLTNTVIKVKIPKFPAAFVGTGDLFTALCTAWLYKTKGDLKLTLENTLNTMQVILDRTLKHANSAAAMTGDAAPTPPQMELKLIQSKDVIENPKSGGVTAELLSS